MWNGKPIWSTTENESIFGIDNKKKAKKQHAYLISFRSFIVHWVLANWYTPSHMSEPCTARGNACTSPMSPYPVCVYIYISLCVIEHMWVTATCSVIILCFCFIFICASAIDFIFSSPFWTKRKNQPNSTFTYLLQINLYNKWI